MKGTSTNKRLAQQFFISLSGASFTHDAAGTDMKPIYLIAFFIFLNISVPAQTQNKPANTTSHPEKIVYPTASMIKISRKKIPEELKFTLMNVSYVGWEKGELYLDTTTFDYALLLPDKYKTFNAKSQSTASVRIDNSSVWHCFTSEGKPLPCSTAPDNNN